MALQCSVRARVVVRETWVPAQLDVNACLATTSLYAIPTTLVHATGGVHATAVALIDVARMCLSKFHRTGA